MTDDLTRLAEAVEAVWEQAAATAPPPGDHNAADHAVALALLASLPPDDPIPADVREAARIYNDLIVKGESPDEAIFTVGYWARDRARELGLLDQEDAR